MDFSAIDYFVLTKVQEAKNEIRKEIDHRMREVEYRMFSQHHEVIKKFRTLEWVSLFHPYKRADREEYREAMTVSGFKKILYQVPNTFHIEVEMLDHYGMNLEVYTHFDKVFKTNLQLEKEYEYDLKLLLDYIRPITLSVNIKFFHYYL